jgi:hypothetical protein
VLWPWSCLADMPTRARSTNAGGQISGPPACPAPAPLLQRAQPMAGTTLRGPAANESPPPSAGRRCADRLRPLQGVCIPVLYGCGFWDEGRTYFVATSIVAGQHPDRGTRGAGQAAEQVGMLREPQSFSTTQASWACAAVSHHMLSRASEALCPACALATGRRPSPAHPPP